MTGLRVRCDASAGPLRLCVDVEMRAPWTVLFGASGSGKTSLLRLIAGLWQPAGARVEHSGLELAAIPAHRRDVVLVSQHPALFPGRNVRQNVAFGAQDRAMAAMMLKRFRLQPLATQAVEHLSGGEAQRVCIARALATDPALLLLDESFSGLHRTLRDELLAELRAVQVERGMQVISVTHDVSEAFACADEMVRLDAGHVTQRGDALSVLAAEREDVLRRLQPRHASLAVGPHL